MANIVVGGAVAVATACHGDGAATPDAAALDAAADASIDAAVDAPVDGRPVDAPPVAVNICAAVTQTVPVTAPLTDMPPLVHLNVPPPDFYWGAVATLDVPVALTRLEMYVSTRAAGAPMAQLYQGCNGPLLAETTLESETYPSLFTVFWSEGTTGPLAAGPYAIAVLVSPTEIDTDPQLVVYGDIAPGEACTGDLVTAGVLSCGPTTNCLGGVCVLAACSNGVDDDGDGRTDAADPGCSAANDVDESDTCLPGGVCPACFNGQDDDGDGATDAPADHGCRRVSDDDERNCPDARPIIEADGTGPYPIVDAAPAVRGCRRWTSTGNERMFHIRKNAASNTIFVSGPQGSQFVIYRDTCDGPGIQCIAITPEGSTEGAFNLPPGDYFVAAFSHGPVNVY